MNPQLLGARPDVGADDLSVRILQPGAPGGLRLVLAHGLEDGWASWQPLVRRLDPQWWVAALDLPWRAGNDYRWRRSGSAAGWLAAGLALLDRPVDAVVAHSFGANAVLELTAAGAGGVGGAAVLVCPLYRPPATRVSWRMLDRSRRNFEEHIHEGVRARLGARAETLDPDVLAAMMSKALDRVGPIGLLTVFEQFVASAELPLAEVRRPTMVLAGGADPTLSAGAAEELAAGLPDAQLRLNEDFDHFCHIRQPDAVAAQVDEFLRAACALPARTGGFVRTQEGAT